MFVCYAIKSLVNGKWYIGLTGDEYRRRLRHLSFRPDLYSLGHEWKILGRRKSLAAIGKLEARLIKRFDTLYPNGNNLRPGGLSGHQLAFVRAYGTENDTFPVPMPQHTKDQIAVKLMLAFEARGNKVSFDTQRARIKKAWNRQRSGLSPLPGTEHYLLKTEEEWKKPRKCTKGIPKTVAARQAMQKAWRKRYANGYVNPATGVSLTQQTKDKVATKHTYNWLKKRRHFNYKRILNSSAEAKKRALKGLPPIPGTEVFIRLRTGPPRGLYFSQIERKAWRDTLVEEVNKWARNRAKHL